MSYFFVPLFHFHYVLLSFPYTFFVPIISSLKLIKLFLLIKRKKEILCQWYSISHRIGMETHNEMYTMQITESISPEPYPMDN